MSLHEVLPSAAAALGVAGFHDTLGFADARHAVVVLIDGLGWRLLQEHRDAAPTISGLDGSGMPTVFPSTTAAALGSLGTGLLPGGHGLVAGTFWLPEADVVLNPLRWSTAASPIAVQPEPTVFERAAAAGVGVSLIGGAEYAHTGLTRAVLRGGNYVATDLADAAGAVVADACRSDRSLVYVYWAELDRVGHVHGAGSTPWRAALRRADRIVAEIADALPSGATMLVTADHGMVNCPPEAQIRIQSEPDLIAGVRLVAGEPRVRHLFVDEPVDHVGARWRARLGELATVHTRLELIDSGLIGPCEDGIDERVGDLVVIAHDDVALASTTDRRVSALLGQHGALTAIERDIPALWRR